MKLCYVASGVADHVVKWLDWFAVRGHEVHLISPLYDIPFRQFHPDVRVHGLKRLMPVSYRSSRLWNLPYWVKQARSVMREARPDLVEGQYIGIPGAIATLTGYHPLVLQAWGSDILLDSKGWPNSMLVKHCLRRADMLFCDSETLKAGMKGLGADMKKVRKVYNGVDTGFFSPDQRPRRQIVISTRYLLPVYQVDVTLRAVPLVLERFPKCRFIIAGDGSERGRLEKLAEELRVKDSVTFTGNVSQKEIRDMLKVSQVYVSTSRSDSTSLCLQEAMACGVACAVSDLPANREWIEHETNGMLTEAGNSFDTANRIKQLLGARERRERFGRLGRMKIVREADLNRNMEKAEGYYRELTA